MSGWTDDRVERLKRLWLQGLSASQIAKDLRGCTRNAVIGKIHRLGLVGRVKAAKPRTVKPLPRPALAARIWSPKQIVDPVLTASPLPLEPPGRGTATIATIGRGLCRWPLGDPRDEAFSLCGAQCSGRYCEPHAAVGRQSANPQPTRYRAHSGTWPGQERPRGTVMDRRWA